MDFYQAHQNDRDKFEIIAFHDNSVSNLAELEKKMRPLEQGVWKGRKLPFPVLLDSSGQTVRTNYGVRGFPTVLLIDPTGILVKNGSTPSNKCSPRRRRLAGRQRFRRRDAR